MSHLKQARLALILPLLLALCACASAVSGPQALSLAKGQGLIGIEFVTAVGNKDYQIKLSGTSGKILRLDKAPYGESIYLFKLPAGHYCIEALYMSGANEYVTPAGGSFCFNVTAGRLTYAGTVSNQLQGFYIIDMADFLQALKKTYPKVYEHYVVGPKSVKKPII